MQVRDRDAGELLLEVQALLYEDTKLAAWARHHPGNDAAGRCGPEMEHDRYGEPYGSDRSVDRTS
jgi:hypothetical protein